MWWQNYQFFFIKLTFVLQILENCNGWVSENKLIESELLQNYDRKHRPVKSESTTMKIQVFLMINHIEKVDEHEQTMLLHGVIWASWTDEYLKWNPADYNNTVILSMEAWKVWQPTFALYNSAKSNGWFVYLNSMPATVSNTGRVFAAGTFSFYVTCMFDFSNFPYDEQSCPIVLADWMYDLSKVNLSDPASSSMNVKPALRLSFDLLKGEPKKHVAGWEVMDSWQRHCYWGANGCVDKMPTAGALDNYWSLLEFGIMIRRHSPYYGLTIVLPTIITASVTLLVFWIEDLSLAIAICVFNILLQSFYGAALIQQLPPGNGSVPKIVSIFGWNMGMTLAAYIAHVLIQYLINVLPHKTRLPIQLRDLSNRLKARSFFQVKGLSFDPNALSFSIMDIKSENEICEQEQQHNALALMSINNGQQNKTNNANNNSSNRLIIEIEPGSDESFKSSSSTQYEQQLLSFEASSSAAGQSPMVELDLSNEDNEKQNDDANLLEISGNGLERSKNWISKKLKKVSAPGSKKYDKNSQILGHCNAGFENESRPVQSVVNENTSNNNVEGQNNVVPVANLELTQKITPEENVLKTDLYILRRLIFTIYFVFFIVLLPLLML